MHKVGFRSFNENWKVQTFFTNKFLIIGWTMKIAEIPRCVGMGPSITFRSVVAKQLQSCNRLKNLDGEWNERACTQARKQACVCYKMCSATLTSTLYTRWGQTNHTYHFESTLMSGKWRCIHKTHLRRYLDMAVLKHSPSVNKQYVFRTCIVWTQQ